MRIKFISIIASFLFLSVAISACLGSDDDYEYSSDAMIHAFGIDTIHGKSYSFTIDQLSRLIYNRDSLPVGSDTIINQILIDTMTVSGWVTSADTVFSTSDSVDLTPAMNSETGMKFKIYAPDGVTNREYTLKVNVHRQDPDSLVWKNMQSEGAVFSTHPTTGKQKAAVIGDELIVYTSNTTAYISSAEPNEYAWRQVSVNNLPDDAKLTSIVNYKDQLYMVTADKRVFRSSNGTDWEEASSLGNNVICLISGFSDRLAGVVEIDGVPYFNTCDGTSWDAGKDLLGNVTLTEVPSEFPTENIYSTVSSVGNGAEKVFLTGMPLPTSGHTVPWFSLDGKSWADLSTSSDAYCPGMQDPAILYYGNNLYMLGGDFSAIYSSITGIAWYPTEKKFLLPQEFKEKGSYSMVVDKNKFIWIIWGGDGNPNEVWRGRLNKLGFKIQ